MKEIKSVYEFAWLTTQQILVTSDAEGQHIKGFGVVSSSCIKTSCFL